jgi:hypothetical protein
MAHSPQQRVSRVVMSCRCYKTNLLPEQLGAATAQLQAAGSRESSCHDHDNNPAYSTYSLFAIGYWILNIELLNIE